MKSWSSFSIPGLSEPSNFLSIPLALPYNCMPFQVMMSIRELDMFFFVELISTVSVAVFIQPQNQIDPASHSWMCFSLQGCAQPDCSLSLKVWS
jgi:hypothetical protein